MSATEAELNDLTKDRLLVIAEENDVDVPSGATKAEVVQALMEAGVTAEEAGVTEDDEADDETEADEAPADVEGETTVSGPGVGTTDVDVADVPDEDHEGEMMPPINVEDWVTLGDEDPIPDPNRGALANVVEAPRDPYEPGTEDEVTITVRTRDDRNELLHIPLSAVKEVHRGGRHSATKYA